MANLALLRLNLDFVVLTMHLQCFRKEVHNGALFHSYMLLIPSLLVMMSRIYVISNSNFMLFLNERFEKLEIFLGVKVAFPLQGFILSKSKYALDIITRARLFETSSVDTPI